MTNIFIRIQRDNGRIEKVEIDDMTDSELDRFIKAKREHQLAKEHDGWDWVKTLASWIRDNVGMIK